jgi:hypothetical protein
VEVHRVLLEPGQRAPQVPDDTRDVPLEMTVKGFLNHEAGIGDQVEITTPAGRCVSGVLTAVNPAHTHRFGSPIAELADIGSELRAILEGKDP